MAAVVLDKVRLFWSGCGCSGKGEVVLGWFTGVLDRVQVFWVRCRCFGVVASVLYKVQEVWIGCGVLDKLRVFRIRCGCSGVGAGFLGKVWVFWSGRRCIRKGCGCSG